jgi:hypothetical protein
MKLVKINKAVSMYSEPAFGSVDENIRYMALTIDSSTLNKKVKFGLAREITKSIGDVDKPGFVDQSKLIIVKSNNLLRWKKYSDLNIKGMDSIIEELSKEDRYFIGLEDPDIWIDEKKLKHIYFTIAFKYKEQKGYKLYLGHAQGKELTKLTATKPVIENNKEIAISPVKNNGFRYVLTESWTSKSEEGMGLLKAKDMNKNWEFLRLAIKPKEEDSSWCSKYASPCKIIDSPYTNIDGNLLGVCTGHARRQVKNGVEYRGDFLPGLFLFNPKTGEVPWVDSEYWFKDPDARIITFASEFIPLSKDKYILYCHINDGFVRAYEVDLKELSKYLKNKFKLEQH